MNIKTVSVHYGRKQNLGDFNSANIECTVWADVTEEDSLHDCMSSLWSMAKENIKAQLMPLVKNNGNTSQVETFLGLEVKK